MDYAAQSITKCPEAKPMEETQLIVQQRINHMHIEAEAFPEISWNNCMKTHRKITILF
jgi:hypothetical protein